MARTYQSAIAARHSVRSEPVVPPKKEINPKVVKALQLFSVGLFMTVATHLLEVWYQWAMSLQ